MERLSALRARTKAPYKIDLHRKTLSALKSRNRPGRAGADRGEEAPGGGKDPRGVHDEHLVQDLPTARTLKFTGLAQTLGRL